MPSYAGQICGALWLWRVDPSVAYLRTTTGRPPRDGLRVNRASNSSGIRHQARGRSQDERSFHSKEGSHATVAFCPWNPSALYYFCLSGSQFYFFFQVSIIAYLACSCPGFQGFRPACMHYGKVERDGSIRRLLGIRMVFLPLNGGSSKLEVQKLDRRRKVSRPGYKRQSSFSVGSTDPEPSGTVTRSPFQRRGITRTNERH